MSDKIFNEIDAYQNRVRQLKKKKIRIKWQNQTKLLHISGGKYL